MTEEKWVKVWMDPDYAIENVGGLHGPFRYIANTLVGNDKWVEGLPPGYVIDSEMNSWRIIVPNKWRNYPQEHPSLANHQPKTTKEDAWKALQDMAPTPVKDEHVFIDTNPKTAFGAVKPGTFQTPPIPLYEYSLAHYQGALKYGHYNWREDPVSISTYINAAKRHMDLYVEGQQNASDTGIHNLAHAMTCLSIVIDAEWYGTLIDDRANPTIRAIEKMEEYFESKKELQLKIAKDWTGHAEKLKTKLNAKKEGKKE